MRILSRAKIIAGLIFMSIYLISCQADTSGLLYYFNSNGKPRKVRNQSTWERRYLQILDSMEIVMGPLPDRTVKTALNQQNLEDTIINGIRRIKIIYEAEKNDRVPAYLL